LLWKIGGETPKEIGAAAPTDAIRATRAGHPGRPGVVESLCRFRGLSGIDRIGSGPLVDISCQKRLDRRWMNGGNVSV
jgi:hypothetical protein